MKNIKTNILNKVHRKINLDRTVLDWKKADPGILGWLRLLNRIDDQKLQKLCGTDIALYITWIRYSAVFFTAISCVNVMVFMIYLTGKPLEVDDYTDPENKDQSAMQAITILNVSATEYKLVIVFVYSTVIIPGLTLFFVFKYITKYQHYEGIEKLNRDAISSSPPENGSLPSIPQSQKVSKEPEDYGMKRYTDLDIAAHSILIEGLPKAFPRAELEQKIRTMFKHIIGGT